MNELKKIDKFYYTLLLTAFSISWKAILSLLKASFSTWGTPATSLSRFTKIKLASVIFKIIRIIINNEY